ncbi:MAG: non-canonical purine NTP pyrophosphatase, RdgB/HAM1 family [Synergistaceae bacterium]|nr:non-canonical purine NTP pyrophosphatase, RdgB/HAM1 family [Synergistaceae bacterium]
MSLFDGLCSRQDKKISIVLASGNAHKREEFSDFFKSFGDVELLSARDFSSCPGDVEENGSSYEENALAKARAWADFTHMPSLADDSGIEVRRMDWKPGIFSARAVSGSDSCRIERLMDEMGRAPDRRARFAVCLVVAFPSFKPVRARDYFAVEARCWGTIARAPSGEHGFGYDPVFIPDGFDKTFADLGPAIKSKISHRAIAMRGVAQILPNMLKYFAACDKFKRTL